MFSDRVQINIRSGKGGDGHVSFRRELYVPNGGPDGGDGGNGGDVIFEVDPGISTLADFRHKRTYAAGDGKEGGKQRRHGKSGDDIVLKVPEGTIIRDLETGKIIADMSGSPGLRKTILHGGKGGIGNMHFATSVMQAPRYAKPGKPALERAVVLELKCMADVGLIGFPNVGKSTFLSRVTHAQPKIANYHFTTLHPNLGVVDFGDHQNGFVLADIPGLIENASQGEGLGHRFLQHIERTRYLIHVVDGAGIEGRDPYDDICTINHELSSYSPQLAEKPQVIALNKMDLLPEVERKRVSEELQERLGGDAGPRVFCVSCATSEGLWDVLSYVRGQLASMQQDRIVYESEFSPEDELIQDELPFTVTRKKGEFYIEGPRIEKMLGYTNLESEKGFLFFQDFLRDNGINDELIRLGVQEGDTVHVCSYDFEYYE